MESAIKGVSGEASPDKMQSVLTPALLAHSDSHNPEVVWFKSHSRNQVIRSQLLNSLIGLREIDSYFLSINTEFFRFRLLDTVFAKIQKTTSKLKNDINFRTVLFVHHGSFFFDRKVPLPDQGFCSCSHGVGAWNYRTPYIQQCELYSLQQNDMKCGILLPA